MKYFAVSDIHGQYDMLVEALDKEGFDPSNEDHKLIICGDLFDRGHQNLEVYRYVRELEDRYPNSIVIIKGNHDLFFNFLVNGSYITYYDRLVRNGFDKTLESFTGLDHNELLDRLDEVPLIINHRHPELIDWINQLPFYYETENYVFTHAGIDYTIKDWHQGNWIEQVWNKLEFYQDINLKEYGFHKKLVMGHYYTSRLTNLTHNDIYYHKDGQKIFIDGGAAMGKGFTINVLMIEDEE
jgi:serine/threonine protein phosphatase 1